MHQSESGSLNDMTRYVPAYSSSCKHFGKECVLLISVSLDATSDSTSYMYSYSWQLRIYCHLTNNQLYQIDGTAQHGNACIVYTHAVPWTGTACPQAPESQ